MFIDNQQAIGMGQSTGLAAGAATQHVQGGIASGIDGVSGAGARVFDYHLVPPAAPEQVQQKKGGLFGFLKKILGPVLEIVQRLAPLLSLIPGIGPAIPMIAGLAGRAMEAVTGAVEGGRQGVMNLARGVQGAAAGLAERAVTLNPLTQGLALGKNVVEGAVKGVAKGIGKVFGF